MKMRKEHKIELAKKVADEIKSAEGVIITEYKGLKFSEIDAIRSSIKKSGNDFRVIKNTLLKKALQSCEISDFDQYLVQSTALIVVKKDFAAVAKDVKKFSKDYQPFNVKAGLMESTFLSESEVLKIADLPSREQLLAQALASLNAPVQNFVSVLANIPRSFLNVLTAIKDKKN